MQNASPEQVVRNYCDRFPAQLAAVLRIFSDGTRDGTSRRAQLERVVAETHRMAGAAHCMGFGFVGMELMQVEQEASRLLDTSLDEQRVGIRHVQEKINEVVRSSRQVRVENSRLMQDRLDGDIAFVDGEHQQAIQKLISRQRILFADDDVTVRNLLRSMLIDMGVGAVQVARSGQDALDAARGFDPTIMILDWQMAPMDGLELLSRIRRSETHLSADTRIIFLTAQNSVEGVKKVIRRGVDHFLVKPFTRDVISRAIVKVAQRA